MDKKPTVQQDWTKEYIKYRIRELFGSMTAMAHCYGLHPSVIRRALAVPYPKVDRVIAMALREDPSTIWPSRYDIEVPAGNPRLWRRWINVKTTTDDDGAPVESTPEN